MYIGETCMVRYPDGDRFTWYNAKIKTIQKHTVSVIWIEGEYRGSETYKIPTSELFLDGTKGCCITMKKDIEEIKSKIDDHEQKMVDRIPVLLQGILEKLDDLNKKHERFIKQFHHGGFFDDDVVSYDSSLNRLADSLRGLSSGSVEMNDIPTFSNKKKYTSYDGNPRY